MARYSISGYIIALRTRSAHTVLAEGKNDQAIIKFCLIKGLDTTSQTKYVIDTVEIIDSDGINYSNTDKVKAIHTSAQKVSLLNKVTCFADREFYGFDLSSKEIDTCPCHRVETDSLFFTRGHSIENYFFDLDFLIDYLEFNHAPDLTDNYREVISRNWDNILLTAASLSLAIAQSHLLTRCAGIFNTSHWVISGEKISADLPVVHAALISRGTDVSIADQVLKDYIAVLAKLQSKPFVCRWLTHGHMGLNIISSAVAKILRSCGMSTDACDRVIGFTELKMKYMCEKWHKKHSSDTNLFPVLLFQRIDRIIKSMS